MSKYHTPILNDDKDIADNIKIFTISGSFPSPIAYQQTYASNGDNKVITYQIIIYDAGLNPLNKIVYK